MEQNDKIIIGGNGSKNDIPKEFIDNEFKIPTESINLPSNGAFYLNNKSSVTIRYLTATSDDILFSVDLLKSGKVLDVLLEHAVIDEDLRPDDMISGDRNYLLIEIRKTGFGNEYMPYKKGECECSSCRETYEPVVDLNKLKPRILEVMPDNDGLYSVELPVTKMNIRFRFLKGSDEKRLSKVIENGQKKTGNFKVSKVITEKYLLQIMEVNGNKDKIYISKFINAMPTKDSLFFRAYNRQIEPGIDLDYEFECPYCNNIDIKQVPINSNLFYPDLKK